MADMLFASSPSGFLESPEGKSQLEAQTMGRFNDVIATPIPWIGKHTSLASSDIIEIGCGAGASTALPSLGP